MSGGTSDQLREMISLLKQLVGQQQKAAIEREQISKAIANRPEFEKQQKEHQRRMEEIKQETDQRRREDQEYRAALLSLLRQLNELLPQILQRLDLLGQNQG